MKLPTVAIIVSIIHQATFNKPPLKVSVYYESYCPACIEYITQQITPAFNRFQGRINIDLNPYGNTQQRYVDKRWEFACQHGPKECTSNEQHACAILQVCGEGGTVGCEPHELRHVVEYISCVMKKPNQLKANKKCAESSGLLVYEILECIFTDGDRLLNFYGNRTDAVTDMKYSPWITIDGKHNEPAQKDLQKEICRVRPELCKDESPQVLMADL